MYAIVRVGYNFDATQNPVVRRQGDSASAGTPVLSVPNFYDAHGYDPTIKHMSSVFFAAGPEIGNGVMPEVHNVDIVPILARFFNIPYFEGVDGFPLPLEPLAVANAVSRKTHSGAAGGPLRRGKFRDVVCVRSSWTAIKPVQRKSGLYPAATLANIDQVGCKTCQDFPRRIAHPGRARRREARVDAP